MLNLKSLTQTPMSSYLVAQVQFLFEKQTETYKRYIEGSIAKENCALATRGWQCSELCSEAGQPERRT